MKKKAIIFFLAAALVFPQMGASAISQTGEENASENGKTHMSPQATDVKVHKKVPLSETERKSLEEKEKGKPTDSRAPKDRTVSSWASGTLGEPLPAGGQRYAVVVGLANYEGTINDLCVADAKTSLENPTIENGLAYYCQDEDALNMKNALIGFGYPEGNITHLRDYQATRAGIKNALDALASKIGENDEVVFFFSGHGTSGKLVSLKDRETIDEAIFTYDNNYIWDDELKAWADSLTVNRMVFAFDICLAGGMNDLGGDNRVIVMSSGENQSSYTFYLGGTQTDTNVFQESEGLFTHYFVKRGMIDELADGSNPISYSDGRVAVEEAFTYAYPLVKFRQSPVLNDKFSNDLFLGYFAL